MLPVLRNEMLRGAMRRFRCVTRRIIAVPAHNVTHRFTSTNLAHDTIYGVYMGLKVGMDFRFVA